MVEVRPQQRRLLVADAESGRRTDLVRLLRAWGHEVFEAGDGPATLRLLREAIVDAVLLDSGLPPLGGPELLKQVRGLARDVPIFCLASPGSVREAVQAMQHGARNYLTRPLAAQELADALRDALPSRPRPPVGAARAVDELAVRQARKMEAVGRLAGGVAQDFNNLLTVITGYSTILLGSLAANDPRRPLAEEILKAVERGASVTRQLLAFSHKPVLQPVVFDLNQIVVKMENLLRPLIGEHVELDLQLAAQPCALEADPGQIEQVIVNLAVNARDAMPDGGRLCVRTACGARAENRGSRVDERVPKGLTERSSSALFDPRPSPGEWVTLTVSDSGCGMDEGTRARVFEPFFTTKEAGKGTGLGLATVHGIVEQYGGHIEVSSEPGRGTTFTISLPHAAEVPAAAASTAAALPLPRGNETVLLMEDEQTVRALVRRILEMQGYTVLEARGGAEAVEFAVRHPGPIHLLISDAIVPQVNGYELAGRLKQIRPDLRVLFITGNAHNPVVEQILREENAVVLPKPFTPGPLALKVREALDRPR